MICILFNGRKHQALLPPDRLPGNTAAENAHRTLGTFPQGTIRLSFGWSTTEADVDAALTALAQL